METIKIKKSKILKKRDKEFSDTEKVIKKNKEEKPKTERRRKKKDIFEEDFTEISEDEKNEYKKIYDELVEINKNNEDEVINILKTIDINKTSKKDRRVLRYLKYYYDGITDEHSYKIGDKKILDPSTIKPGELKVSSQSAVGALSKKINIVLLHKIFREKYKDKDHDIIRGGKYGKDAWGEVKITKIQNKKRNKKEEKNKIDNDNVENDDDEINSKGDTKEEENKTDNIDDDDEINSKRDKTEFYNQGTVAARTSPNGKIITIEFFLNGSISLTGCVNNDDGMKAVNNVLNEAKKYREIFYDYTKDEIDDIKMINYKITMINTGYDAGFRIDRAKLTETLRNISDIFVSYNPERYQGVKISYMYNENNDNKDGICYCNPQCKYEKRMRPKNKCKIITIAIFQAGKNIITGANDIKQSLEAYNYINDVLANNYLDIVRLSIEDEKFDE